MKSFFSERFTLVRVLRDDGNSKTLLAHDHLLERENVIVRIIRKESVQIDPDQLIEHFSWSIGLQHSQFAKVFDAGLAGRRHLYHVRECLPPLESASVEALSLARFLVAAVDFLSTHGRFHGGIRPSNILVEEEGFKLADARRVERRLHDGAESLHFTAPEILQGTDPSCEADLYSVGSVLFYTLTGRHLFEDSDLNRLKYKYLSATPQVASFSYAVSAQISEVVLELLNRNPEKRRGAFDRLKRALTLETVPADRAAFVGRVDLLHQTIETIQKPATGLRAVLLEGEAGIGKSRYLSELQLHCRLRGFAFAAWRCTDNCFTEFRKALHRILRSGADSFLTASKFDHRNLLNRIISEHDGISDRSRLAEQTYPFERTVSDAIALLGSLARRLPIVLAIDDAHLVDADMLALLSQLAYRASEIPLTLVMTARTNNVDPKLVGVFAANLKDEFLRARLSALSVQESIRLIQFFEEDQERQAYVSRLSMGNPLFIENYSKCKLPLDAAPAPVTEASASMLSGLTPETQAVLRCLSVFRSPIQVATLATLCGKDVADLNKELDIGTGLGLIRRIGDTLEITYPVVRMQLYASIAKQERIRLNRLAFAALRETDDTDLLSHHAFEGRMFLEAASLYCELANRNYRLRNYRNALAYYKRLHRCRTRSFVNPHDLLRLGRCYEWAGRQGVARQIYESLLSIEHVRNDPELLSAVYGRLSIAFNQIAAEKRLHYFELAIACLPDNSPHILQRYCESIMEFMRSGDLSRASDALRRAEERVIREKGDFHALDSLRGLLLSATGSFRGAKECYVSSLALEGVTLELGRTALSNNLAVCFEHLGDLSSALEYQHSAYRFAVTNGNVPLQILSLGNLAAMKMKRGAMHEAKEFFDKARDEIKRLNAAEGFDRERFFFGLGVDSILYAVYGADYCVAADRLKRIRIVLGPAIPMERAIYEITRCKFFVAIGLTMKARQILRKLREVRNFDMDFIQVERALVEAQLPEIPAIDRLKDLHHALERSDNLGTLYQRCELLISLASVHLEIPERAKAEDSVQKALALANKNGYKILAARASLLSGVSSENSRERQQFLSDAVFSVGPDRFDALRQLRRHFCPHRN